jgi:ABC-2 type transport system permease protein
MAIVPAVAIVGILALAARFGEGAGDVISEGSPIRYDSYFSTISTIVILFCAAQAPELFGRDQRYGVLSLYFARALRRSDYALARIGGFVAALLILELFPQLVLFLGRVLLAPDIVQAVGDDLPSIPPILAQGLLSAGLLGGLSMAVSAFTPRRAYATAGIIALFVIPGIVASVVGGIGSTDVGSWLFLASPTTVLDGTNAVLFDSELGSEFFFVDVPDWAWFVAAIGGIVGSIALTLRRFARITA